MSFLNGLKNGRFKFSLTEQKGMTLVDALWEAEYFMRASQIYAKSGDVSDS